MKPMVYHQFNHPNMTNFVCPVCGTSADFPVVLVLNPKTVHDGIGEASQVHSDCWRVWCKMNGYRVVIKKQLMPD